MMKAHAQLPGQRPHSMTKTHHSMEKRQNGLIDSRKTNKLYSRMMDLDSEIKASRNDTLITASQNRAATALAQADKTSSKGQILRT